MIKHSSRRGSALLIVLGMLSFIVVSAVAFATYMRYSRLPSSYLRRTSASRLLVKAALAEAIERIDASIGNNPYPGVGEEKCRIPRKDDADGAFINHNYWRDRVFVGWDPNSPDKDTREEVEPNETISTLNVEALAYVPPPFINDLRYWSRRSVAGKWHSLAFDSGRYAFAALDVSDCFDINRMEANASRDSSDMGRITLAHSFENEQHTGNYTVDPSNWDNFMKNFIDPSGTKVPLVSLADLNLVINDKRPSGIISPFAEYIVNGRKFVPSETGNEAELVRNMTFITESYSAATNSTDVLDISLEENQPQYAADSSGDKEKDNEEGLSDILNVSGDKFIQHLTKKVSVPKLLPAILYDYLDRDSVPVSLAIPTVERTPMIIGVTVVPQNFALNMIVDTPIERPGQAIDPMTGKPKEYTRVTTGKLSVAAKLAGRLGFVYPFKYRHGTKHPNFKAQMAATIAFVKDSAKASNLRLGENARPCQPSEWPTSKKSELKKLNNEKLPAVITLFSDVKQITYPQSIEDEEKDAVLADITFDFAETDNLNFAAAFEPSPLAAAITDPLPDGTCRLIEKLDGNKALIQGQRQFQTLFSGVTDNLSNTVQSNEGDVFYPVIQVWARIIDENNKVVDLVPACLADDDKPFTELGSVMKGSRDPGALRVLPTNFEEAQLVIDGDHLKNAQPIVVTAFTPAGYLTGDPRYNYAPENWIALTTGGGSFRDLWFQMQESQVGLRSRDGDIFMMTSDANYLQSIYELMMMPDFSGGEVFSKDMSTLDSGYDGKMRTSFSQTPAYKAMWRTLSSDRARDQLRQMKVTSGTKGFRVNPNTRDVNIMLSALSGTPMDWWAASTNEDVKAGLITDSKIDPDRVVLDLKKNLNYTINAEHGKLVNGVAEPEASLTRLAQRLMQVFAEAGQKNESWETAYDNLDWEADDEVAGVDIGMALHSVDRKFLYGYWRECFDNRQQLFLIFVRAEPMMMGGGGLGQTPPQLGGRAVALVWRDPNRPTGKAGSSSTNPLPHRTRVLFYRQLD